jgi:hypothetical protein
MYHTAFARASATQVVTSDQLLVFLAQFNPINSTVGRLRRYSQMVFEIMYVDPRNAPAANRWYGRRKWLYVG